MSFLKDVNKMIKAFEKIDNQRKREEKSRERALRKAIIIRQKEERKLIVEARKQATDLKKSDNKFRESYVIHIRLHIDTAHPWGEHAV